MQMNNEKYNSTKAVEMRKELNEIREKMNALQYDLFILGNEAKTKEHEYLLFLGVVKEEKEKEDENVQ